MKGGLGRAWDIFYSQRHPIPNLGPFPVPSGAESEFNFNQTVDLYLTPGKSFRISVGGWENDYLGGKFGKILNPYASCPDAVHFSEKEFSGTSYKSNGGFDDPVGEATSFIFFRTVANRTNTIRSRGPITEEPKIGKNDPNDNFRLTFSVRVSRP